MTNGLELMQIRNAAPEDFAEILALNEASVQFLSPLSLERITTLHAHAAYHRVVATSDGVQAFLLALRERADYDSMNYRWFSARLTAFLYIDRVVVSPSAQGREQALMIDEVAPSKRANGGIADDGLAALAPWHQASRYY